MPSLHELQAQFSRAVFSPHTAAPTLLAHCAGAPEQAQRGLTAYRASILANLAGAVYASYPTIAVIIGPEALRQLCHRYAAHSPSLSGDLNGYGHDFDLLLATHPELTELPYLPAVARLDWLIQTLATAEDIPQDLSQLATLAPEQWDRLRFTLDPACACLASSWPIGTLWRVNQPDDDGDFRVNLSIAETVLVQRRRHGIAVEILSAGDAIVLNRLAAGETLGMAVQAAADSGSAFDLAAALQHWIQHGVLRRANLEETI